MVLVWQGLGFLGLLIPLSFFYFGKLLTNAVLGHGYTAAHGWPGSASLLLSAVVLWFLADQLSASERRRVDSRTGQMVTLTRKHTLFWIPLRYVALIVSGIAVLVVLFPHAV